ncbi:DMT family transporter [Nitrosophilus alvini]|uniref:DMT family transporter n=1 Tax=Nitrosophilus alvini TaxID=2714855 RepID=UPI00190D34D9|nr:DMT family transporter [Nitrosophilus alvini]
MTRIDRGILYMLLASFLFAGMGVFAKLLSESLSSLEVVFFRNIFGVFIVAATLLGKPMKHEGGKPWLLIFRGLMGFVALLCFFYNIAHIPLGEAMTYSKTSPIFTALFAYLFLKEKLGLKGWLALFLGFLGIVFIAKPFGTGFDRYDILGILSGVGAALAYTSIRELKKYYDTRAIVLSFMLVGTVGPLILMALSEYVQIKELDFVFGRFVMPEGIMWVYIVCMGFLATFAQIFMTKAYGVTKAGIAGAVSYSNIVFSIIMGYLFLGDLLPDIVTATGIALIVIAGIAVAKEGKIKA